jgi:hypothetical protein
MILLLVKLAIVGDMRFTEIKSNRRERRDERVLRRLRLMQALVMITWVGQPIVI